MSVSSSNSIVEIENALRKNVPNGLIDGMDTESREYTSILKLWDFELNIKGSKRAKIAKSTENPWYSKVFAVMSYKLN